MSHAWGGLPLAPPSPAIVDSSVGVAVDLEERVQGILASFRRSQRILQSATLRHKSAAPTDAPSLDATDRLRQSIRAGVFFGGAGGAMESADLASDGSATVHSADDVRVPGFRRQFHVDSLADEGTVLPPPAKRVRPFVAPSSQAHPVDASTSGTATRGDLLRALLAKKRSKQMQDDVQEHEAALSVSRHVPWKLARVVAGHQGWVRCVAVSNDNAWFATGASDNQIKIWDLASGLLKLSLTGHVGPVRGLAISPVASSQMFSCAEDNSVKQWDLATNRVSKWYYGHTAAVYAVATHPTIANVFFSAGRDRLVRLWDTRTGSCVHAMQGHRDAVTSLAAQGVEPQLLSGSIDSTIRLWDIVAGRSRTVLTHHSRPVKSLCMHPVDLAFLSAGVDAVRKWKLPEGIFVQALSQPPAAAAAAILPVGGPDGLHPDLVVANEDGLVAGCSSSSDRLVLWDWKSCQLVQDIGADTAAAAEESVDRQPRGVLGASFDKSGRRLLTCGIDRTVKIWKPSV